MRGLVAALVAANLILILWWVFAPRPAEVPPAGPVAASPLILLHEVPAPPPRLMQAPTAEASTAGDEGEEATPVQGCHALGPYPDRDLAMAVRESLLEVGLPATPRAEDASQRLGFWVHTPPTSNRGNTDTVVDRLRRVGIRDFYVVADGEYENAVSLGVFSQVDSAERHAERLRGLGFDVIVGERLRRITAWWLDFPTPPTGSVAADRVIELALAGGEGLTLMPKPCD